MLWVGLAVVGLIAICGGLSIALWHSHEGEQQDEIEALQGELEEVARWVDTGS